MYEWIGKLTQNERLMKRWAWLLGRSPRRLTAGLCRIAGLLLERAVGPTVRREVRHNMAEVLQQASDNRIRGMSRRYFVHGAFTLFELLAGRATLPKNGAALIRTEGEERLTAALDRGKGAIVYVPHLGNFFYYYWYLSQQYDCLAVATASSPELRPLYLQFQEMGCKGLDYDETPPLELLRRLRAHLAGGGIVFMMGDFNRPAFPVTTMFGRKTRHPAGAAVLALEMEAPVIPMYGYRMKGWNHRVVFGEPLLLHERFHRKEREAAMQLLSDALETGIRQAPEQWFYWFNAHERWEPEPGNTAGSGLGTGTFIREAHQPVSFGSPVSER